MEASIQTDNGFDEYLNQMGAVLERIPLAPLLEMAQVIVEVVRLGGSIYICGNGGSASTASHIACDLAKNTLAEGSPRPKVISVNDNIGLLTAWANDTDYSRVFSEQIETLAGPGDAVVLISASGNSDNILEAAQAGVKSGAVVMGMTGFGGGELAKVADPVVVVPSEDYGWVESAHLVMGHMLTNALRESLRV